MIRKFKFLTTVIVLSFFGGAQVTGQIIFQDSFEPISAKLIHHWSFSETGESGTTLQDIIGAADGSIVEVGDNAAWVRNGELHITGGDRDSSDYAFLPADLLSGFSSASIEIWATHDVLQTWGRIFDIGTDVTNSLLMTWDFAGDSTSDRMQWRGPPDGVLDGEMAPYVFGTQYQIVMTIERNAGDVNSSLVRLFRDGVLQGQVNIGNTLSSLAGGEFWLSRSIYPFDPSASATYNEIRLYSGVLTEEEVAARFAAGPIDDKVEHKVFLGGGNFGLQAGSYITLSASITSTGPPISQAVTWSSSKPGVATVNSAGLLVGRSSGWTIITATSQEDPTASASKTINIRPAGVIHLYRFNETGDSGTILKDSSSGADGLLVRVGEHDSSVGSGRVSLVGGAKDSADYIRLGSFLTYLRSGFTIELWAATSSTKAWGRIFDFGPSTSDYLMMSWTQFANQATDRIEMRRNDITAFTTNDSMAPYQFGLDYHIVMTVAEKGGSGGNTLIKWYRNGDLMGSAETPATWSGMFDEDNWLGRSKYNDQTANASYDELRIYSGVMSDAEVAESYATGPFGGGAVITVNVTGPTTVEVGQTIQMTGTVNSTAGTISQAVTWVSESPAIATVNSTGVVTGMSAGVSSITATSQLVPSIHGSFGVTVPNPPPPAPLGAQAVLYDAVSDKFFSFRYTHYLSTTWQQPWPEGSWALSDNAPGWSGWPAEWGTGDVDAAFYYPPEAKFYLFKGNEYVRHSAHAGVDGGTPKPITGNRPEWPPSWDAGDLDAVVYSPGNNKVYFFKGNEYSKATWGSGPDRDYPLPIAGNWAGWPSSWGAGDVDAVSYYPGNGKFYLFKGYEYVSHSFHRPIDDHYPKSYDQWKFPNQPAVSDLVRDFDELKNGWSRQSWSSMGYPSSWSDSRSVNDHIQGVTRVSNGDWVLSHSQTDDPGFLIYGKSGNFTMWQSDSWGDHPGSIQASTNVVAIPFSSPKETRFVHFGGSGSPVELSHLRIADAGPEQVYRLEGGASFIIPDPLMVGGTLLSNQFQTNINPVIGSGNELVLTLTAQLNGGTDVIALKNLLVTGFKNATFQQIAHDMVGSTSNNLISYVNNAPTFSSAQDCFGKTQRPGGPNNILDDSLSEPSDNMGIIRQGDNDEYFCMIDTVNPNNAGPVVAKWTFDISGVDVGGPAFLGVSLDIAAMGDFESNDGFSLTASIDGGAQQSVFSNFLFKSGAPNSVGLAYYPPRNAYFAIVGTTSNAIQEGYYPVYMSIPGAALTNPNNTFTKQGVIKVDGSETGMQLVYDYKTGSMHLLTLYRTEESDTTPISHHHAVLSRLDLNNFTSTFIRSRNNFETSTNALSDPTFRYGAGALIDDFGRLNLIATERCIPPDPTGVFEIDCLSLDGQVDYFILKP